MKLVIYVILLLTVTVPIFPVDMTTELKVQGFDSGEYPFEVEGTGRITLKDETHEDYSFFVEYRFGEDSDKIDAAQIKFMRTKTDIEIGRNRIGWGAGYSFNPTDIFNEIPLGAMYDPTYLKPGRDSVIVTRYIGDSFLQGIYALKKNSEKGEDYGIKYKTSILDSDIDVLYIHKGKRNTEWGELEERDDIIGGDIGGSIPGLDYGVWIEGVYYLQRDDFIYIAGLDNYFAEKYHVMFEYLYHGLGEKRKENYNLNRIFAGRLAGKNYLMPSLSYEYSEKLMLTGYFFINADDYSYSLGVTATYLYNDHIDVSLIPFYLGGKEGSEYKILADELGGIGITAIIRAVF